MTKIELSSWNDDQPSTHELDLIGSQHLTDVVERVTGQILGLVGAALKHKSHPLQDQLPHVRR